MIKRGFVDEVKDLLATGYALNLPSMSSIGYKQIAMFIKGQMELNKAVDQIKKETHRFARHQYAWFRPEDTRIHWFNENDDVLKEATRLVDSFLMNTREQAG
jgi:tRNA dimethylallyltransferase